MDKWSRMVFNIQTNYDHEVGNNEEQYRKLRDKLQTFKHPEPKTKEPQEKLRPDGIQRGRVGIILP